MGAVKLPFSLQPFPPFLHPPSLHLAPWRKSSTYRQKFEKLNSLQLRDFQLSEALNNISVFRSCSVFMLLSAVLGSGCGGSLHLACFVETLVDWFPNPQYGRSGFKCVKNSAELKLNLQIKSTLRRPTLHPVHAEDAAHEGQGLVTELYCV